MSRYYHTDRLGILVWQDMPETIHATGSGPTFMSELAAMVKGRRNHPSIIQWDIFNECSPAKETLEKSVQVHSNPAANNGPVLCIPLVFIAQHTLHTKLPKDAVIDSIVAE